MKTPRILVQSCVAVLLAAPFGCSESTDPPPAGQMSELQVGKRPESVTRGFGGLLYVSVQNEDSGPADVDGEVKVVDANNKVSTFVGGMREPKGIVLIGSYLVVTDVTRVWKIDSAGTKSVLAEAAAFVPFVGAAVDFPKNGFLNDAAVEPGNQAVFVTEMGQVGKVINSMTMPATLWAPNSPEAAQIMPEARVFRITVPAGVVTVAVDKSPEMLVLNGVAAPAADRMLLAEFFHGNILERTGTTLRTLATGYRGADGIEQDDQGNIYVTSFTQGKVWKLDRAGQNPKVLIDGRGFGSTADPFLDLQNRRLVVPDTATGTLIFQPI